MILQVVGQRFTDAHFVEVPLQKPSVPQSRLLLAVVADRSCAMVVRDGPGGAARSWRRVNDCATSLWHRQLGAQGGVSAIEIETAHQQKITGKILALEVAGLSVCDALSKLSEMLAESS